MKLDDLGDDAMEFKILALKSFCLGMFENRKAYIGDIEGIRPSFEYNDGLDTLKSTMYSYDDFMLAELGTCKDFRSYLKGLEKINEILGDCPFVEMYKETNTFLGVPIQECKIWWETNIDIIFQPHLIKEFFESDLDCLNFQSMHLKMLELFRFCSNNGLLQIATNKSFGAFN